MSAFLVQVGSLLTAPPGNLIYQLVLAFCLGGALQAAYLYWRTTNSVTDRRTMLGLGAMLIVLGAFFILGIGVIQQGSIAAMILPPIDRMVTLLLLIGAIWLWVFPETSRLPDLGAALAGFGVLAAGVLNLGLGALQPDADFNHTVADILWQIASIGLVMTGAALLYIRRTPGFVNGLAFLALALLGHGLHLVVREAGDYSGIVRLAYIAAFPLLLTIPQRFVAHPEPGLAAPRAQEALSTDLRGSTADTKTVHAWLGLAAETDVSKALKTMARAVSHTMLADLCFVVLPADDRSRLEFAGGYDLIREDYLERTSVDTAILPRLTHAMQRGRALRLQANATAEDVKGIAGIFGLKSPGNLLSAPIVMPGNEPLGAVVLLSPYSEREWSTEDQNLLVSIAAGLAPVLERARTEAPYVQQSEDPGEALRLKDEEILRLQRRNDDMTMQLETVALGGESAAGAAELESLRSASEQAGIRIRELEQALEAAQASAKPSEPELEAQLKQTLMDLARLQNQLAEAQQRVLDLEGTPGGEKRKTEQAEVIASISQELRQPMSSIIGYTDLLLGESVGILGALQRKFIERIKASTERIGGLVNDLIQLTTLEVGLTELKPEAMDLNLIIDNALAYTSGQIREKKISIHLDLPKLAASVNADREALQQILIHLLQNAGSATPVEGTITLRVLTTQDEGRPYVMIQVTDSGGGIPEEDLPRVFTRLFRADNVLIQGVGDTGVGLSIAKTLTEAQHGRIWVESHPGSGATFCVLLPAVADATGMVPGREKR